MAERLQHQGAVFYPWHAPAGFVAPMAADEAVYRFVTSFATTPLEVDAFHALL
jgi:threonine aldolase